MTLKDSRNTGAAPASGEREAGRYLPSSFTRRPSSAPLAFPWEVVDVSDPTGDGKVRIDTLAWDQLIWYGNGTAYTSGGTANDNLGIPNIGGTKIDHSTPPTLAVTANTNYLFLKVTVSAATPSSTAMFAYSVDDSEMTMETSSNPSESETVGYKRIAQITSSVVDGDRRITNILQQHFAPLLYKRIGYTVHEFSLAT